MNKLNVEFDSLIGKMNAAPRYGKDGPNRLTILGGQFQPERFTVFLTAWRKRWQKLPWRIWEQINEIVFADEPLDPELLQRGEIFGEGGHLSLRRDENRWFWRYIGPPDQLAPEGFNQEQECDNFWAAKQNSDVIFSCYEDHTLLWGKEIQDQNNQPTGRWWEDRVAAARLVYPAQLKSYERVYLKFWRFTAAGRTQFVWYYGLEGGV